MAFFVHKKYLRVLMVPLFQHLLCLSFFSCLPCYFLFPLEKKSVILLLLSKAGLSLEYYQKVLMFSIKQHYILLNYTQILLYQCHETHLLVVFYFTYEFSKWSKIFKYSFFIGIICICTCDCCVVDGYSLFNTYVCITIITKFDLIIEALNLI